MTVGKIALGVFLGNVLFGLVAWAVFAIVIEGARQSAVTAQVNADYQAAVAHHDAEAAVAKLPVKP